MAESIENLVEVAREYMRTIDAFWKAQKSRSAEVLERAIQKGVFGGFHPEVRKEIIAMDMDSEEAPYNVARKLLSGRTYGAEETQAMLEKAGNFRIYDPDVFEDYGKFLSIMIAHVLRNENEIRLDAKNRTPVHVPDFHKKEGIEFSYPWEMESSKLYDRDNLLIAYLGSALDSGKLVVNGNVGKFFAAHNNGANVEFNGECGWRPCYEMNNGKVIINGVAGHCLADYASGGTIIVNGTIRSIGGPYTNAYAYNIFHNGILIPKKKVGGPFHPGAN